jgi:enoyl-CoA hydratase/carnithine racemase
MNAPETALPILLREDCAGVATLTLNRPTQFNSLSEELLAELQATLNVIAADNSVRAVVIAGAGKAFCSGHDLKQMRANPAKDYQQKLFKACGKDDDDADRTAAASDRAHPRHRHGSWLPAGRHVRPGRRRRGRKVRRVRA